jgi:hypothetical protein
MNTGGTENVKKTLVYFISLSLLIKPLIISYIWLYIFNRQAIFPLMDLLYIGCYDLSLSFPALSSPTIREKYNNQS